MDFARPDWLWSLTAVPVLGLLLIVDARRRNAQVSQLLGDRLAPALAPFRSWRKMLLKGFLKCTALGLMIVAAAGPRFGTQLEKVQREGVDVVVALDTSLSMLAEDMLPNRLERAKRSIVDLIAGLQGDRIGLVVFAGDAYTLCPLTVDYDAALMFTQTVDVDMVSTPGTRIDKALETALEMFDTTRRQDRAVILVTDGENHEGEPMDQARLAAEAGVRVFTIGIGNPAGELIPERGTDGRVAGYKKDRRGETVLTQLDEKTLQDVAAASGGKYLPATRDGLELKVLYSEISGMDKRLIEGEFRETKKERFWMFLLGAMFALFIDGWLTTRALNRTRSQRLLHTGAVLALMLVVPGVVSAKSVKRGKVVEGNRYFASQQYREALNEYRNAVSDTSAMAKDIAGVFYNQANTLYQLNQLDQALELYKRSYSSDSALTADMLYNRGNALRDAGQLSAAVESYVGALQYAPDDADTRHNLEMVLKQLQQQQQQEQQQQDQQQQRDQQQQDQQQQQQNDQQQTPPDSTQQQQQQNDQQQNQEGQQQQQEDDQGEQIEQPEQTLPDSSAVQPQADTTQVPQPQLTPAEMNQLSREDALRILQALEERERKLQEEKRRAAFRRKARKGKDW